MLSASPLLPLPPPGSWGSQCSPAHPHLISKRILQVQTQYLWSLGSLCRSQRCQDQREVLFSASVPPGSAWGKADPGAASRKAWLFPLKCVRMKQPLAPICCQGKAGFSPWTAIPWKELCHTETEPHFSWHQYSPKPHHFLIPPAPR